jgi:hypothetical protein
MSNPAATSADLRGGVRHVIPAVWGAVSGVAPHVLHHVGPLAGAAVLAGLGGQISFFALGAVATIPMLRRLHRRFATWLAPGIALGLFLVTFLVSTLVLGPLLTGEDTTAVATVDEVARDEHGH